MKISRRDFLNSGVALGAMSLMGQAEAGLHLHGTSGVAPTGQKAQVNLNIFSSEFDFPFINMAPTYSRLNARDAPSQDVFALMNADNYPSAVATGSGGWQSFGSLYYPGGYATFTGSISGTTLTVSSAVTGDALAVGRTVRGVGITDGTRIVSGSGVSWQVNQSMSATGSIAIIASIPWVIDWTGNSNVTLGFNQQLVNVTGVTINSNRREYHLEPIKGAVVTGSISAGTLAVSAFVTGSVIHNGMALTGPGIPPFCIIQDAGGGGGTGNYSFGKTTSYTTTNLQYTIADTVFGTTLSSAIGIDTIVTTPGAIRIYRQDQESLLNAGQLCAPHFISYYSQYGRIRFLNWMQTNGNMQGQWIQRPGITNFSWGSNNVVPLVYGGIAVKTASTNDYAAPNAISYTDTSGVVQSNPSVWTDGMMLQTQVSAIPTLKAVTGMVWDSGTSKTKVTAVAHGFTTGDVVFFPAGEISGGLWEGKLNFGLDNGLLAKCVYTIAVVDADNFTLNGINSSTWGTYSSGGHVGWQLRFKSGSLPYKIATDTATLQTMQTAVLNGLTQLPNQYMITLTYSADLDALIMTTGNSGNKGVPIEIACKVCNECQTDAWISVPMYVTDNFVTQMATTIKATLNHAAGRKWLFELANEVWNTSLGFSQSVYSQYKAYAQFPGTFTDGTRALYEWYGYRFGQMAALVNAIYSGGNHGQCIRIFGFKTDDGISAPTINDWRALAPTIAPPVTPASLADEFCCDTYIGKTAVAGGGGDFATQADAQQAIGTYQQGVLTSNSAMITTALNMADTAFQSSFSISTAIYTYWKGYAASYSVRLCAYEGGFSVLPAFWYGGANKPLTPMSYLGIAFNNLDQLNLWTAYQLSSQYGAAYTLYLNQWKAQNGTYFSQYQSTGLGPDGQSMWEMRFPGIFGATNPGEVAFNAYNAS